MRSDDIILDANIVAGKRDDCMVYRYKGQVWKKVSDKLIRKIASAMIVMETLIRSEACYFAFNACSSVSR